MGRFYTSRAFRRHQDRAIRSLDEQGMISGRAFRRHIDRMIRSPDEQDTTSGSEEEVKGPISK